MGDDKDTVVVTRVFDALRETVFRMWTDPAMAAKWFGLPRGAVSDVCEIDPRPGGKIRVVSRNLDGSRYPMLGVVDEVVPPRLMVFRSESPLAAFARTAPADGAAAWRCVNRATFEEEGPGKTRVTIEVRLVHCAVDSKEDMLAGFESGWGESLELLEEAISHRPPFS